MSYRVLAKPRLILDEMCRLYGKFASYLRRVLCKTRLIFPRINGPIERVQIDAIKFERTEIHFSTDVFTAVIVVLAEGPYFSICSIDKNRYRFINR